jgi:glyoxylase-like metal-dependent hydrolase (beta-lactamase superfamily II)
MSDPLLIFAENPGALTGAGNNTWFIDGAEPALIDAGVGSANHVAALARALKGRSLRRVIVTHHHADHASGLTALSERWPSLEACKFVRHGETGWRAVSDGERLRAGDRWLTVIHTPGHADDHVCLWDPERSDLFSGDMVLSGTTVVIPAGRGGNLRLYLASLERLAALVPRRIFPGHGEVILDATDVIEAHVAHRQRREREIVASLAAGASTVELIVERVYPGLAMNLIPAARLTVLAHLEKLREEGKLEARS